MDDSPAALRRIRTSLKLGLRGMATQLRKLDAPYSHVALSYYETGQRPIPEGLVKQYEEVAGLLTTMGQAEDPVATLTTLGRSDVDRRSFLRHAAYTAAGVVVPTAVTTQSTTVHVGSSDVERVRQWVTTFADLDERFGGNFGRTTVAEFCTTELPRLLKGTFANEQVKKAMFGAATEAAYLLGWMSHDVGFDGAAQRYYENAQKLAAVADPGAHTAWTLRIQCHQAFTLGFGAEYIDMAETACRLAAGKVDPHTEALLTITAARAHAAAGNRRQALAAVTRTERQMVRPVDQAPRWAGTSGPAGGPPLARIHNQIGVTLAALGDHAGAEEQARHGLALWNRETNPRIWAITLARVAIAQHDQGRTGEAADTWRTALPYLDGIQSERVARLRRIGQAHIAAA